MLEVSNLSLKTAQRNAYSLICAVSNQWAPPVITDIFLIGFRDSREPETLISNNRKKVSLSSRGLRAEPPRSECVGPSHPKNGGFRGMEPGI